MLSPISKDDLPTKGGRPKNPLREFAAQTLDEFMDASKPGDFFEVSGWPGGESAERVSTAAKVRAELRDEAWRRGLLDEVRPSRSGARVFLERLERREPPRPYPDK